MNTIRLFFGIILIMVLFSSCESDFNDSEPEKYGNMKIKFHFFNGNDTLQFNDPWYINEAGNPYQVYSIKYVISRLKVYNQKGEVIHLDDADIYHFVTSENPSTLVWDIKDKIIPATYDSLSFTFGFDKWDNKTNAFPNIAPFEWPDFIGGGYHYMQFDGYYKNENNEISSFNFHLGIGQYYDKDGNLLSYVQNYFKPNIKAVPFTIKDGDTTVLHLNMDVSEWFKNPYKYNFNTDGVAIMMSQPAMYSAAKNGRDVFTIKIENQ